MADAGTRTRQIQGWLDRLRAGDESAREELLRTACDRLTLLTRKMLRSYARLRRWEQTDDVLQNASVRLYRALAKVCPPDVAGFFRLAALNIRRELLDLSKHHFGPQGSAAHHRSGATPRDADGLVEEVPDPSNSPPRLAAWTEFHDAIEALPEESRTMFDLLWYQGLSQAEAAEVLHVSERTIKRRWRDARLALHAALGGEFPDV